jgi:hypothetical protein
MNSPLWQLHGHSAQLQLAQLTGRIDLSRPAKGLAGLGCQANSLENAHLLGIRISSLPPGQAEAPVECYVRNSDLVAAYDPSDCRPIQVEARWRAVAPSESNGPLVVIELVVSVRTHLLDGRPEVSVQSAAPAADVLRLTDQRSAEFERLDRRRPCVLDPGGGTGCLVFRLPHSDLSYAEMVHPADFLEDRLQGDAESAPIAKLSHRLFPSPLEKGVILLARVQGMLLPRSDDTRVAAERYAAFAVAEPPLGA